MRVWDLSPGYLNRGSLLGEHRELHGILAILANGKRGYSRHPETLRWTGALDGLACRHSQLAAEMRLRGYVDRTPVPWTQARSSWPEVFVTEPADQVTLLRRKYAGRSKGRIRLPRHAMELWLHHEYSVMARSLDDRRRLARSVRRMRAPAPRPELVRELVSILREHPDPRGTTTAIEAMWSRVRHQARLEERAAAGMGPLQMLLRTQSVAARIRDRHVLSSTALSDLAVFAGLCDGGLRAVSC